MGSPGIGSLEKYAADIFGPVPHFFSLTFEAPLAILDIKQPNQVIGQKKILCPTFNFLMARFFFQPALFRTFVAAEFPKDTFADSVKSPKACVILEFLFFFCGRHYMVPRTPTESFTVAR